MISPAANMLAASLPSFIRMRACLFTRVPRDDAAVEFRRAGIDRDRVALRGIADLLHALVEQHLEDRAAIVGRAADQEIIRGLAPIFLQPFDVGLKAAGGGDQRRGAYVL